MQQTSEEKSVDHLLLDSTVEQRQNFIRMMTPDGKLPEDPKEKSLILKALDGIDKVAVSRMRIKIEDRTAASQEKVAQLLAHVYKDVGKENPYVIKDLNAAPTEQRGAIPELPPEFANINLVQDETAVNPRQLTYKDFMSDKTTP